MLSDDLFRGSFGNDIPAAFSSFRPEIDDMIGHFDHLHVVFDDENSISFSDQFVQNTQAVLSHLQNADLL